VRLRRVLPEFSTTKNRRARRNVVRLRRDFLSLLTTNHANFAKGDEVRLRRDEPGRQADRNKAVSSNRTPNGPTPHREVFRAWVREFGAGA